MSTTDFEGAMTEGARVGEKAGVREGQKGAGVKRIRSVKGGEREDSL